MLTTANGILDHEEARRKKVGGKLLGGVVFFFTSYMFADAFQNFVFPCDDTMRFIHLKAVNDVMKCTLPP